MYASTKPSRKKRIGRVVRRVIAPVPVAAIGVSVLALTVLVAIDSDLSATALQTLLWLGIATATLTAVVAGWVGVRTVRRLRSLGCRIRWLLASVGAAKGGAWLGANLLLAAPLLLIPGGERLGIALLYYAPALAAVNGAAFWWWRRRAAQRRVRKRRTKPRSMTPGHTTLGSRGPLEHEAARQPAMGHGQTSAQSYVLEEPQRRPEDTARPAARPAVGSGDRVPPSLREVIVGEFANRIDRFERMGHALPDCQIGQVRGELSQLSLEQLCDLKELLAAVCPDLAGEPNAPELRPAAAESRAADLSDLKNEEIHNVLAILKGDVLFKVHPVSKRVFRRLDTWDDKLAKAEAAMREKHVDAKLRQRVHDICGELRWYNPLDDLCSLRDTIEIQSRIDHLIYRADQILYLIANTDHSAAGAELEDLRGRIAASDYTFRQFLADTEHLSPEKRNLYAEKLLGVDCPPAIDRNPDQRFLNYEATKLESIIDVLENGDIHANDVFFDIGGGMGKVPMLVHWATGARAVSVEYQQPLCIASAELGRRLGFSGFEVMHADARAVDYSGGTKFFLFNPFLGEILRETMAKIEVVARSATVPITVFCVTLQTAEELKRLDWLEPIDLGGAEKGFWEVFAFRGRCAEASACD
jgi:hypothetical protein